MSTTTTLSIPVVVTTPARRQCAACGRAFIQRSARPQRYCSTRCRVAAHRQAAPELTFGPCNEWAATTLAPPSEITAPRPRAIQEVPANAHSLQRQKPGGATSGIVGPPMVIAAEVVAGRDWRAVVSPDGVRCEAGQLRPRALVGGSGS